MARGVRSDTTVERNTRFRFFESVCTQTVEVMTKLIEEGYYDGCVFYRAEKSPSCFSCFVESG